ncbi:MAG: MBL fold metallo-hydrolase [Proteobacteria bacterium]|nr:MBL fold metallo-hydrolase [Pseudomonadota bacterium]
MDRRKFLKSVFLGAGGVLAGTAGIKALRGDFRIYTHPLGLADTLPEMQEEMKLILLGTGMPMPCIYRSKPAQVILAGRKVFLVDCGAGVVTRLVEAGIAPERIENVFITHNHSDHTSGFENVFISSWNSGRSMPLSVYGPGNTKDIIGKLMAHLNWDISLRIAQAKNSPEGAKIHYGEMEEGLICEEEGVKVTVFPVDHGIVKPAVGYKFEYKGKVIVISGDTQPCENMVRYSEKADVLVHEAYSKRWLDKGLKRFPEKRAMVEGIMEYHSSTLEAAEIAQRAKVKHLVFTHLIPGPAPVWYFEKDWAKGVSDVYKGKVTVGRDLMVL